MKFEEQLTRLEEILNLLDNTDVSLDDSLALYEEGISLVRHCNERLEKAKLQVEEIEKNSNCS